MAVVTFPSLSLSTYYVPVPTARGSSVCYVNALRAFGLCHALLYVLRHVAAFNPHAGPVREKLLSFPFYGWSNRGSQRGGHWLPVAQLSWGRGGI